jgi:hypothetical protein
VKWSVGLEAEGDRVLTHDEIVELADAVAPSSGIATGIGTNRYGAQLMVDADGQAGLPEYPVVRTTAVNEDEDEDAGQ